MRPRGNPNFKTDQNPGFTTDRPEPLKVKIGVRVAESMARRLDELPDKNEFIRQAISTALDTMDAMGEELADLGKLIAG